MKKPEIEKESAISIYNQLATSLRQQILSGKLGPGDKLSPELELAEKYAVSRGTIRQAILLLVSEGLVERVQGKGTFVRHNRENTAPGGVIGLIVPYARDSLTMDILLGAENAAKSRGYSLLFSYTGESLQQEAADIQRMRGENAAGLILFPTSNVSYDKTIWQLHQEGFPLVLVDRYFPDLACDYVVVDNRGGAYWATEHLLNLGHTTVAFVSASDMQTTSVKDRLQGYQRALADHGQAYSENWLCCYPKGRTEDEAGLEAIREFLRRPDRPRALFAVNDYTALKVVRAAHAEGLTIPKDLALVGFDDIQLAAQLEVPLTTIAQPRYEIGVRAAHLLIDRINGMHTATSHVILPTTLVIRQSCGARQHLESNRG